MPKRKSALGLGALLARVFWLCVAGGTAWCAYEQYRLGEWPWARKKWSLGGIELLRRTDWSASEPTEALGRMQRPTRITIHHTGGSIVTADDRDSAARSIKAMQTDHMRKRRWSDIGYHYIVDRAGRVWEGRPADSIGAHAGSAAANDRNLGIVLLGNFDQQSPSTAQAASLEKLVGALRARSSIPRSQVLSHSEVRGDCGLGPTSCPGKHLSAWIEGYRRKPVSNSTDRIRTPSADRRSDRIRS